MQCLTGVKLELISDIDMYQIIAKGIRGGIFYISKRFSEANNKYMEPYDDSKPSKYISYLDTNTNMGREWVNIFCMVSLGS